MPRFAFPSAVALAIATFSIGPRPCVAATSFDRVAQAWMGAVAFLADDEGQERSDGDRGKRHRHERDHGQRDRGEGGRRHRGEHSQGRGPRPGMGGGPRVVMAKMDEILVRLARIEAKLDRRAGGPPHGEWRGPRPPHGGPGSRPEMGEHARRMEESPGMGREGEGRWPEVPEEVREQMRRRMEGAQAELRAEMRKRVEEGRERMEQARQKFREMEERIKKLEAEIKRLKAEPPTTN